MSIEVAQLRVWPLRRFERGLNFLRRGAIAENVEFFLRVRDSVVILLGASITVIQKLLYRSKSNLCYHADVRSAGSGGWFHLY